MDCADTSREITPILYTCSGCCTEGEEMNTPEILREVIKTCVRKLGLVQKADAACCGITITQCHTLVEIGRGQSLSLNELSGALTLDKSTMSRTVENLVNAELVERQIDSADRRYTKIQLTAKGAEMVEQINSSMIKYFAQVIHAIPDDKRTIFEEVLPFLLAAVKETELCIDVQQSSYESSERKGGCSCE